MSSCLRRANNAYLEKSVSFEEDTWPWYQKALHKYRQLKRQYKRNYKFQRRRLRKIWVYLLSDDDDYVVMTPPQSSTLLSVLESSDSGEESN